MNNKDISNQVVSMDKKYVNRKGDPIRVICVDNFSDDDDNQFCVIGILNGMILTYLTNGSYYLDQISDSDLIEVKEKKKAYLEVFSYTHSEDKVPCFLLHKNKESLLESVNDHSDSSYILLATKEIEWEEGEFCHV